MLDQVEKRTNQLLTPYLPSFLVDWASASPDDRAREIDATVAFVDISGFTKLSERLAKRGKVGAEELADAINACFTRLLAVAYSHGGVLIKFGGDALLLLFTTDWVSFSIFDLWPVALIVAGLAILAHAFGFRAPGNMTLLLMANRFLAKPGLRQARRQPAS